MTFEKAFKLMPACMAGCVDTPKTVADLRFAALHEIDLFEEGEECLTAEEITEVKAYLRKLRAA